ncbi:hypothetical protein GCM10010182_36960 [Actinomadura cremea]|nr:hypothetical protein GCM10010182_36960 [Actinomadura cremea]
MTAVRNAQSAATASSGARTSIVIRDRMEEKREVVTVAGPFRRARLSALGGGTYGGKPPDASCTGVCGAYYVTGSG